MDELQDIHSEERLAAILPSYSSVQASLYRARAEVRPMLPASRAEISLGAPWTETTDCRPFLIFDNGSEDRILGFTTEELMTALCDAETVYIDGTFHITPMLFSQLYTLHLFYRKQMIPAAFFLLPKKNKETYRRMFQLMREYAATIGRTFDTRAFQLDYEVSALQAAEEEFPLAEKKGCFFHFSQCLWSKVQAYGLVPYYDDESVHKFLRSCSALALVPLDRIDDRWLEIQARSKPPSSHPAYTALKRFKEYFISTWLENSTIYPRGLWSHHENLGPRTTHHLEGWHRVLNTTIGRAPVNSFEMIGHLQNLEKANKRSMLMLRLGHEPPRLRKICRVLNEKLTEFVRQYQSREITLTEYIHNVGYNTKLGEPIPESDEEDS